MILPVVWNAFISTTVQTSVKNLRTFGNVVRNLKCLDSAFQGEAMGHEGLEVQKASGGQAYMHHTMSVNDVV